jgi:hypothetical protein
MVLPPIGIILSVGLALFRYRFPALHPRLASAGIGICLAFALAEWLVVGPGLLASIVANGALGAVVLDGMLSGRRTAEAAGAYLRLRFHGDMRAPTAIRSTNIANWFVYNSPQILLQEDAPDGSRRVVAQNPPTRTILIIYDRPTEVDQIVVGINAPGLPAYQVLQSTKRGCVVTFTDQIPAGELELDIRP